MLFCCGCQYDLLGVVFFVAALLVEAWSCTTLSAANALTSLVDECETEEANV